MSEYNAINIIPENAPEYAKYKDITNIVTSNLMLNMIMNLIEEIVKKTTPEICAGVISVMNQKRKKFNYPGEVTQFTSTVGVERLGMQQFVQNNLQSEAMRGAVYRLLLQMYRTADVINMSQFLLGESPLHILNIYEPQLLELVSLTDAYYIDLLYYTVSALANTNIMVGGDYKHNWRITIQELANILSDYWYYAASAATFALSKEAIDSAFKERHTDLVKYYAATANSEGTSLTHAVYLIALTFDQVIDNPKLMTENQTNLIKWLASHSEGMDMRKEYGIVMHTLMSEIKKKEYLIPKIDYQVKKMGIPGAANSMFSPGEVVEIINPTTNRREKYVFGTDGRFHLNSTQGQLPGSRSIDQIRNKYNSTPLTKWRRGTLNFDYDALKKANVTSGSKGNSYGSERFKQQLQIEHDKSSKALAKRVSPGELAKSFEVKGALTNKIAKTVPTPKVGMKGKIGWISLLIDAVGIGYYVYSLLSDPDVPKPYSWDDSGQKRQSTAHLALMGVSNAVMSIVQRNYVGLQVHAAKGQYTYQSQALQFINKRDGSILVSDDLMLMNVLLSEWYAEEIGKDMFIFNFLHLNCLETCSEITKNAWSKRLDDLYLIKDTSTYKIPAYTEATLWYSILDQCITEFVGVKSILDGKILGEVDISEGVITTLTSIVTDTINHIILE